MEMSEQVCTTTSTTRQNSYRTYATGGNAMGSYSAQERQPGQYPMRRLECYMDKRRDGWSGGAAELGQPILTAQWDPEGSTATAMQYVYTWR